MVARAVSTSHAPLASTRMAPVRADGVADRGHPVDVARVAHLDLDRGVEPAAMAAASSGPTAGTMALTGIESRTAAGHVPHAASSAAARARAGSHG